MNELNMEIHKMEIEFSNKKKPLNERLNELNMEVSKFTSNKEIHIIERFMFWMEHSVKDTSDYISDSPMFNMMDTEYRYQTIEILDYLHDMFYCNKIREHIIDLDYNKKNVEKSIEIFERIDEDYDVDFDQENLTYIMEDAIVQNLYEATCDW